MSNKPKIHAFCAAGCKWETVHRDEFLRSASIVACRKQEEDGSFLLDMLKTYRIKKTTPIGNSNYGFRLVITYTVNGMGYATTLYNPDDVPIQDVMGQYYNFDASYKDYLTVRLCDVYGFNGVHVAVIEYDGKRFMPLLVTSATEGDVIESAQLMIVGANECFLVNELAEVKAKDGISPVLEIDEVVTLEEGERAYVDIDNADPAKPRLNFGIPKGAVVVLTQADREAIVADVISSLPAYNGEVVTE